MFRKAASPSTPPRSSEKQGEASPAKKKGSPKSSPSSPAKKADVIADCSKSYEAFAKKLKELLAALKKRQDCMGAHRKADQEVVRQMTALVKDTPLAVGKKSYASVHEPLAKKMVEFEDTYATKIIDYASEWSKLLNLTFTSEIKDAKNARKELEHYRKKVSSLHIDRERLLAKGKDIPPKNTEKIERNEDKLATAERNVKKHDKNLTNLVGELVDRSWKDLYPLLVELLQFEMKTSESKAKSLASLKDVLSSLSEVATEHNLNNTGRSATELWRSRQAELPKVEKPKSISRESSDEFGPSTDEE